MHPVFDGLAKELRSHGVKVKKVRGWKGRGSPTFQPRRMLNHHTASPRTSGPAPCVNLVTIGRSDLPGPLCNFLLGRDGTVYFVAAGRANHAGLGGPKRGIPKDSGNAYMLGTEWENDGIGEPYPEKQTRAGVILNAVCLRRMKQSAWGQFEHRIWTTRKIDRQVHTKTFRKLVARGLRDLKKKRRKKR